MSGDPFQVQFHPKLGVVIYDPVAQMGLAREQMRLFKIGSMTPDFLARVVSKDLGACTEGPLERKCHGCGFLSHRSQHPPQTVLRGLSPAFRLGGFHGLQGLQRDSLHVWHLSCVSRSRRRKAA